ncbi:hypothetical protein PR048_028026, partial [Dryococelus australis]
MDNEDKMWKIRPLQFIREPIRFGYKVWCLTSVQGYLVNFSIYQGKSPRSNTVYEHYFGKATAPLIQMIESFNAEIRTLPFHFFFDNLFLVLNSLYFLRDKGYGGTGTMRNNRIPKSCPMTGHHDSAIVKEDGAIVSEWVDNSVVSIASNCLGVEPQSTAKRYSQKEKRIIQVQRPYLKGEYSQKTGGVDHLDKNVGTYRINIRNKKWYWPLLSWLIDVSVHSAWQLARGSGKKYTQLEFRRGIVQVYLSRFANPSKGLGRPSTSSSKSGIPEEVRFNCLNHLVKKCEEKKMCWRRMPV